MQLLQNLFPLSIYPRDAHQIDHNGFAALKRRWKALEELGKRPQRRPSQLSLDH